MSGIWARSGEGSPLTRAFIRLGMLTGLGSFLIVALLPLAEEVRTKGIGSVGLLVKAGLLACVAIVATLGFSYLLKKLENLIDSISMVQGQFLDEIDPKNVNLAILLSASLSLFLELAVIRWQSSIFEFFAFYKNFSLLACFLGLGLGYALATKDRVPLVLVIPLMAWQFGFMTLVRFGPRTPFQTVPFREQLAMGIGRSNLVAIVVLYGLLTVVFLLTTLAFIPLGQVCGRLMERRPKLPAYGLNLLGSVTGVLLMLLLSFLWAPPLVWFSLCFIAILFFQVRKPAVMVMGFVFAIICTVILAWPVMPLWARVYSPYQLLEIGHDENSGLTLIRAAGNYYQRIFDFAGEGADSRWAGVRKYYELPYQVHPQPLNVAVVGAGTGNDVAAALRSGAGHVEAIEIDPAIVLVGKNNHPEKPYEDPRVHVEVNDARSFLRGTNQKFDLIVYGLLDSHTLLSHGSSLRLDSFVYTVEGLREARNRLNSNGVLSLSFTVLSNEMGHKIYLMLKDVFDGRPPVCMSTRYDSSVMFIESNDRNWIPSADLSENTGFTNRTEFYANPLLLADVSTDDWPFFYMPRRIYPASYLVMVFQILFLSVLFSASFFAERPQFSHLSFFFLGMGFMLVETKGITEMGLTFGNTWQVIGFVIAGILTMAFLGNCTVQWLKIQRSIVPYLLVLGALAVGLFVSKAGGFASTPTGRLETIVLLTCPLFFSGIVFSSLLSGKEQVSGIMASNLLGAMCGGLLEYNSMYFGFRSLYVMAMGCYILAFVADLFSAKLAREHTPRTS